MLHKCAHMHVCAIKLSGCVCVCGFWGIEVCGLVFVVVVGGGCCLYAVVQWHLIHNADRLSLN